MAQLNFMPFKDPRRERCGLCRQRLALAYLLLIRDGGRVAGEMELCARCAMLMKDIFTQEGELEELVAADREEGE